MLDYCLARTNMVLDLLQSFFACDAFTQTMELLIDSGVVGHVQALGGQDLARFMRLAQQVQHTECAWALIQERGYASHPGRLGTAMCSCGS